MIPFAIAGVQMYVSGTFLSPPLHSRRYGHGTRYTAVYWPRRAEMGLRWPGMTRRHGIGTTVPGRRTMKLVDGAVPVRSKC